MVEQKYNCSSINPNTVSEILNLQPHLYSSHLNLPDLCERRTRKCVAAKFAKSVGCSLSTALANDSNAAGNPSGTVNCPLLNTEDISKSKSFSFWWYGSKMKHWSTWIFLRKDHVSETLSCRDHESKLSYDTWLWMTIKIKWINVYFALIWSIWASFYNITNESNLMIVLVFSGIFILTYIFLFRLKSNWVKNSSFGFFFLKLFWCEYLNPFTYCSLVLFLILFFSSFDTWDVTLDNQ